MQPPALEKTASPPLWQSCRWTLGLCAAMAVFNLGLFPGTPAGLGRLVEVLQFDRGAILDGQLWRLLTGNLVHWSPEHFFLDVGAFAVVGLLYERHLGRHYPWLLLLAGLAVGSGVLLFLPQMSVYRGLSGVDSGQFAAAVCAEVCLARSDRRRWLWVAPAASVFLLKIVSECATGRMFFGTESLGNIGDPVPLAHAAGTVAAAVFLLCAVPGKGDGAHLLEKPGGCFAQMSPVPFSLRSTTTPADHEKAATGLSAPSGVNTIGMSS